MKRRLLILSTVIIIAALVFLSGAYTYYKVGTSNQEVYAPTTLSNSNTELVDLQELQNITSDLMMAIDLKTKLLSGGSLITFADGTTIKLDAPSASTIRQLDDQIDKLTTLLIDRIETKRIEWKK